MVPARTGTRESRSSEAVTSEREIFIGNPFVRTLDNLSGIVRLESQKVETIDVSSFAISLPKSCEANTYNGAMAAIERWDF
jgi:hypothetical protein